MPSGSGHPTEGQIVNEIRLALSRVGCITWRNHTGAVNVGGRWQRFGLAPGMPDIIGIYNGKFVAIEVKTPRGRPTEEQNQWIYLIQKNQGLAGIARNVSDALRIIGYP